MHLLVLALLVLSPGRIVWAAPAECPTNADVQARIEALAPDADLDDLDVEATVREEGEAWIVDVALRVEDRSFTRRLEAERCAVLAEAVALVVATTVDPLASAHAVREAPSATQAPVAAPEPPAIADPSVTVAPRPVARAPARPRPAMRIGLGVGVGAEAGAMPGPTGSASGAIAVERDRLRIELGGSYFIRRRGGLDDGRASVGLGVAVLRGCGRLGATRLFVLCLGTEVGAMRGEAIGIADGRSRLEPWAAALGSAGVIGEVAPRVRLFARGEVGVAFVRPRFELRPVGDDPIPLHEPGLVSARVAAGIEIAFRLTKGQGVRE